jgi:L-ribulokinase
MGRVDEGVYQPDPDDARAYDALYAEYRALHDHFGRGGNDVMLRLRAIRNTALEVAATRTDTVLEAIG